MISTSLEIVLLKKTLILHWDQFIYEEGSDDEIRIVFGTHDVIVRGAGRPALLADISAQHVASIHQPTPPDPTVSQARRRGSSAKSKSGESMRLLECEPVAGSKMRVGSYDAK